MFAAHGSTISAAISLPYSSKSFSTEAVSLYFARSVYFVQPSVTPAPDGIACVISPEPAFTSNPSE